MDNLQLLYEDWAYVPHYEGLYIISNRGRIQSMTRFVARKGSTSPLVKKNGQILRPSLTEGYLQIVLSKNDNRKSFKVHRLVAITFVPNPNNLPEVNHIYGVRGDSCAYRLEWVTRLQNIRHSWETLRNLEADSSNKRKVWQRQDYRTKCLGAMHSESARKKAAPKISRGNNYRAKKIIDTVTGNIFDCIADASDATGINRKSLQKWLSGNRQNKSSLCYL